MKVTVTYQKTTQSLQCKPEITLNYFRTLVQENFKNLPNHFMIRECKTKKEVKTQEELTKIMQTKAPELTFQIIQKVQIDSGEEFHEITMEEKPEGLKQICSDMDDSREQDKNTDSILSENIRKLLPGIICDLSERKNKNSETNNTKMLCHFFKIVKKRYNTLMENVCKKCTCIQELIEHEKYLNTKVPTELQHLNCERTTICNLMEECNIKEEFQCYLNDLMKLHCECKQTLENRLRCICNERRDFAKEFCQEQSEFRRMIECCEKQMKTIQCEENLEHYLEMMTECCTIIEDLQTYIERAEKYNCMEKMFCSAVSDYSYLTNWKREMCVYQCFWNCAHEWKTCCQEWMSCPLNNLDICQIETLIKNCCMDISRVRTNPCQNLLVSLCNTLYCCIEEMRSCLPLMKLLTCPAMNEKYCHQISNKINMKLTPTTPLSFLFQNNMKCHYNYCLEVCEKAQCEFTIYNVLDNIEKCWKNMEICMKMKDDNCYKFTNLCELMQLVEKHQTQLTNLKPYPCYEKELTCWQQKLTTMMNTLECLNKLENIWAQNCTAWCNPCFRQRIPCIEQEFVPLATSWKEICEMFQQNLCATHCLCLEKCIQKVNCLCEKIEKMQKATSCFLVEKRREFPRFYFLCNDNLIDLLCNPQPKHVCKYLNNMFENIHEFVIENHCITGLVSNEMETLNLVTNVSTMNRHPEVWLKELECTMKNSVHHEMKKTLEKPWNCNMIKTHLSQCVLTCSQLDWTTTTETAIKSQTLKEHHQKCEKELVEQVKMMKTCLTKNERNTLHPLITLNVHANEIVNCMMRDNVQCVDSFKWKCYTRTYQNENSCEVRCLDHCVPHFGEFLGNTPRLVMTPLTDRAYMSMMTAMRLGIGSAPSGPAGTGKTETVKDLARMCWQYCCIVACSDQFDYLNCANILRGVASSGVWCCFDEFNRISVEVLSTMAHQLQTLFTARETKQDTFTIHGEETRIIPSFNINISMNPGYAGRTELPEQYKCLFRPISFIVPDMHLIAEIKLYSMGIVDANCISKKMINLFETCKQQLTPQPHYDFGMRKMMTVLRQMQVICTDNSNMTNSQILALALRKVMCPMMCPEDVTVFECILKDCCPEYLEKMEPTCISHFIPQCCRKLQIHPNNMFNDKVCQLYDTMNFRHGVMLVGEAGVGKTCIERTLASVMECHEQACVTRHIINPKSMDCNNLFGSFCGETWRDGIVTDIMRKCSQNNTNDMNWIKFDGPTDPEWVESLNTVLDDNKALMLPNGDRIMLTPNMRVLFEVESTQNCTPAFISRLGMVCVPINTFDIHSVTELWLQCLPDAICCRDKTITTMRYLFREFLPLCLNFIMDECCLIVPNMTMPHLLQQFLTLLRCQINHCCQHNLLNQFDHCVSELFNWCLVWSMGCMVTTQCRDNFDAFLKRIFKQKMREIFPPQTNVFDVRFCLKTKQWMNWNRMMNETTMKPSQFPCHNVIPTTEMTRNMFVMNMLMNEGCPVLLAGPMCTGKTTMCLQTISQLPPNCRLHTMKFTPSTPVNCVQNMLTQNMTPTRNMCIPKEGKMVVCIDDMNMAPRSVYGDQMVNEWVRMCLENNCWYNCENLTKMTCQDVMFCANMTVGPHFFNMSPRVLRQFNVICCPEVHETTLTQIFSHGICHWLKQQPENIRFFHSEITQACVKMCTFNYPMQVPLQHCPQFILRDAMKVMNGICSAHCPTITCPTDLMKLLKHEHMRVFQDRLCTMQHQQKYNNKITEIINECFCMEECVPCERIVFADYMENINETTRPYCEVKDFNEFMCRTQCYVEKMTQCEEYACMMTPEICEYIARICRVLRQPKGHCLVLGPRGCGRRLYSRMASYIMGCNVQEITMGENYPHTEWRTQLKNIIFRAIETNNRCCVILPDCHLTECMICDLMCMMKVENIQHYLTTNDEEYLTSCCRVECNRRNMTLVKENLIKICQERLMNNVHFIMCMNPEEPEFQNCVRKFPHLLCETTINWICQWPQESMMTMARNVLPTCEKTVNVKTDYVTEACMRIHHCFETERVNFTPSEYIPACYENCYFEFLNMFKTLCTKEVERYTEERTRLQNCLTKLNECMKAMSQCRREMRTCPSSTKVSCKVEHMEKMMDKMQERKNCWTQDLQCLENNFRMMYGNCMMRAAMTVYCPPMTNECRMKMRKMWEQQLRNCKVPYTHDEYLNCMMMRECSHLDWCLDTVCKDNMMMMMERTNRLPMFVDPENHMKKNLCHMVENRCGELCMVPCCHPNLVCHVENVLCNGKWVLIEDITNTNMPQALLTMLCNLPTAQRCRVMLLTNQPCPTFNSQMMSQMFVINCTMTMTRVEDQLLNHIMSMDHCNMQNQMMQGWIEYTQCMNNKKRTEEMLVDCLCNSEESLVGNESFMSMMISLNMCCRRVDLTYKNCCSLDSQYQEVRNRYRPCACFAAMLFCCVRELVCVNPMYHINFEWFMNLYTRCMKKCPPTMVICNKMTNINKCFSEELFTCVCRQIFPEHRMMLACMLACKEMENDYCVTRDEVNCFVSWANENLFVPTNPTNWISHAQWPCVYTELKRLSCLDRFKDIHAHFMKNHTQWETMCECVNMEKFPHPYNNLNVFHKLMIVKVLFPQHLMTCMCEFVRMVLGDFFCQPINYNLTTIFKQSTCTTPILVMNQEGFTECFREEMNRCAHEMNMHQHMQFMCLSQGGVQQVFQTLRTCCTEKKWLVIENCYQHPKCLPELMQVWQQIHNNCHKEFRLWLRCMPTCHFPPQFMNNCMRVCWQPTTNCRTLMKSIFTHCHQTDFTQCCKPDLLMRMFYACCMLHCVVMERRNYENIGWRMKYMFNIEDLMCCLKQMRMVLNCCPVIPFQRLQYMICEIFYGGRINDARDRQLMMALTKMFINEKTLQPCHPLTPTNNFLQLDNNCNWTQLMKTIDCLPPMTTTDLCLPPPACTMHNMNMCYNMVSNLHCMPIMRNTCTTQETLCTVETLECMLPNCFNMKELNNKFPVTMDNLMNFCLRQECNTYNNLICRVREDLCLMKKCLNKQEFMTSMVQNMICCIQENKVPNNWRKFNPCMPLNVWMSNLQRRVKYFCEWMRHGQPHCLDLSMFMQPQTVFTCCLQHFSRKHFKNIEDLTFEMKFIDMEPNNIKCMPDDGCYVSGLFVEGACWNTTTKQLMEAKPCETYSCLPVMHLLPRVNRKVCETPMHNCPLYQWLPRRGTLDIPRMNTFMRNLELPTNLTPEECVRNCVTAFVSFQCC